MSYSMNDFGNTAKWQERVVGTGEIIARTFDTARMRNNIAGDEAWLTTVNSIDVISQGVLDVEIYVNRYANKTGLGITRDQQGDGFGFFLERNSGYGVIAWQHGGAQKIIPDPKPTDEPVSLRIRIDTTVSPSIVIYFYDGIEIFRGEVAPWYALSSQYVNLYAKAVTITGTSTFLSTYVPPPQHNLTIQASTGGTTSPAIGTYAYNEGTNVQVAAASDAGYMFSYWERDGINVGSVNPTIVAMDTDHTLLAVFVALPPTPKHTLTVDSTPIQDIPFTIERAS